eukprot:15205707-Ditylum_brightwellii.AAC.1
MSTNNDLGRLVAEFKDKIKGSNTIALITKDSNPKGKRDWLEYSRNTATPAASLLETKLLINSIIYNADNGAQLLGLGIKDFFLQTPLPPREREYMRIQKKYFDKEFIQEYNLQDRLNEDGYVYCEIKK